MKNFNEQKEELIDKNDGQVVLKSKKHILLREIIISSVLILLVSILTVISLALKIDTNSSLNVLNQFILSSSLLIHSSWIGLILILLFNLLIFTIRPSYIKPKFKNVKDIIFFILFNLLGLLAFIVLIQIFSASAFNINLNVTLVFYLASLLTLTYSYIIYKLFLENFIDEKHVIWEIIRFALVGLVASLFDYFITSLVRMAFNSLQDTIYATITAVTCGFLIGVLVNYLLSITMVYKNTNSNKARTKKGIVIFIILSAIGLFIGIGFEAIFYNKNVIYLQPYVIVFLLRTIIVMTYNYLSRKFILFK